MWGQVWNFFPFLQKRITEQRFFATMCKILVLVVLFPVIPIFAGMKIFALIMSAVILAISCLPCTDGTLIGKDHKDQTETTKSQSQDKDHDGPDECPPLCTCACCSASTGLVPYLKLQSAKLIFQSHQYPLVDIAFHSEVFSSIWQPPRNS